MSRGAFLIPKLSVLGNRQAEAVQLLISKGLSTITDNQARFIELVLEYLKRHDDRIHRDLAMEMIEALSRSSDPPFHFIDRGTEARITVSNDQIDISVNANIKVRWNLTGKVLESTATATVGNIYSSEVQIQDFELYHSGFYRLDVIYEDGTDRYPITPLYVVVKSSQGVDGVLLSAPALTSAVVDGGGEFTVFTWVNPTHKDFRYAQLRTSDGLILYRGNGTTYDWHHDLTGTETFKLYSEGPGGHAVESEPFNVAGLTISTTNVITGGTNLQSLITTQAASPDSVRNINFLDGDPVKEAWQFGEGDLRIEDGDIGSSLVPVNAEWPITITNYATVDTYGYSFKLEVDDCDGLCLFTTETHFAKFGYAVLLILAPEETTWATAGVSYPYRIYVTDPSTVVQEVVSGCFTKIPCPQVAEDAPPNEHYVETVTTNSTLAATTTTSDCGCS